MSSLPWMEVLFSGGALLFGWHQVRLMRKDRLKREAEERESERES